MAVEKDSIQAICDKVTQHVASLYEGLHLHFIIHGQADFNEMLSLSEHIIITHPASNAAQSIIRRQTTNNKTSFLGMAIHQKKKMMGLKNEDKILALFNLNINDLENEAEAIETIYHLAWHAIDLYEIRKEPQYRKKFSDGPMIPKRSALNLSKANMQADIFSALVVELSEQQPSIQNIAMRRSVNSLRAIAHIRAEDYPYIVASQACELALSELKNELASEPQNLKAIIEKCRQVSLDIGQAFDEESIKQWWNYTKPAQDMAWRGFSKEDILGAAVNTCDDTFVRATSLLVSQTTNIEPSPASALEYTYNAFLDTKSQAIAHSKLIDTVFEDAMTEVEDDGSNGDSGSRALMNAANKQNEKLTEGHILGWCANALQEAAHAFEKALISGSSPTQAARMQFEGNKGDTSWDTLKELGEDIVDQKRNGFAVTMGHIAEICHNHPAFAPVLGSLKITMNDPGYLQKLEAANDLAMTPSTPAHAPSTPSVSPKGPAPKAPKLSGPNATPSEPSPQATPAAAPSLGGNNRAQQIMKQRQLAAQKIEQEKNKNKETQTE